MLTTEARKEEKIYWKDKVCWGMPFRATIFVKKQAYEEVREFVEKNKTGAPVTIYGHAGTGKTQVALEYSIEHMRVNTLWFSADTIHALYHSYDAFCHHSLGKDQKQETPNREFIRNKLVKFLEQQISDGKSCLIVYDNYHSKLAQKSFYEHLILVPGVDVIITSRTFSGTDHNVYVSGLSEEMDEKNQSEASLLLRERTGKEISKEQMTALTKRCNHNPLLLTCVAKMITSLAGLNNMSVKDSCTSWLEAKSVPAYIDFDNVVQAQLSFFQEKVPDAVKKNYMACFLSILRHLKPKAIAKDLLVDWIQEDLLDSTKEGDDRATPKQIAEYVCDACVQQLELCSLLKDDDDCEEIHLHPSIKNCLTAYFDTFSIEKNMLSTLACIRFLTKRKTINSVPNHWEEAHESLLEFLNNIQEKLKQGLLLSDHANELLHHLYWQQVNLLKNVMISHFSLGFIENAHDYLTLAKQLLKTHAAVQEKKDNWSLASGWQLLQVEILKFEKNIWEKFPRVEEQNRVFVMGLQRIAENKSDVKLLTGPMGEPKLVKQIFSYLFKLPPSKEDTTLDDSPVQEPARGYTK